MDSANIESVFEADRNLSCDYCKFSATKEEYLTRHTKEQHTDVQCFPCTLCSYQAKRSSHLKNHISAIHKKEKHNCPICQYQSSTKDALKVHIKSVHKAEKSDRRYSCQQCDFITTKKAYKGETWKFGVTFMQQM